MWNHPRLLKSFSLPVHMTQAFDAEWKRSADLFADEFRMKVEVKENEISFSYFIQPAEKEEQKTWNFKVGLTDKGRACIKESEGIDPPLKTVYRAQDFVKQVQEQLKTNPKVTTVLGVNKTKNQL